MEQHRQQKRFASNKLQPIQEAPPNAEASVLHARRVQSAEELPDEVFIIRNLDTGLSIDVRDTNKATFTETFTKVMDLDSSDFANQYLQSVRDKNQQLWQAAQNNDPQACFELLSWDNDPYCIAQVNSRGLYDWTALHIASDSGFLEVARTLIFDGETIDIEAKTSNGQTPLHLACGHGHLQIVELLLQEGAHIDAKDSQLQTPLHLACTYGQLRVVEFLLQNGASINEQDITNKSPIELAANLEIVQAIEQFSKDNDLQLELDGYSRTPFHTVVIHNSRLDRINALIRKGRVSPNKADIREVLKKSRTFKDSLGSINEESEKQEEKEPEFVRVGPEDFEGLLMLGKGSFGQVFLMRKLDNDKLYAVKILDKNKVFSSNLIRYAFTERNILHKISHPFIVKLNYAFQTDRKLSLVMDYYNGGDFGRLLREHRRLPDEMIQLYCAEITLAIGELHSHGIVFRDLKPENIVLDDDGHAHLTDFGLSKEGVFFGQTSRSFCGSVAYLPPEMLRRRGHDKSVDWYLLGVLTYEMFNGKPPYYHSNRDRLYYNIQKAKLEFLKPVSPIAEDFIRLLLDRNPRRRLGFGIDDVEEVKAHQFFHGIDWEALYNKQYTPVKPTIPKRVFKKIATEDIFGNNEETPSKQIEDWSVLGAR